MTEALRSWIVGIAGAALVTAVAMTVTPECKVKRIVSLVCGLLTVVALLRPVRSLDLESFSRNIVQYKSDAMAFSSTIESANEILTKRIIEDKCSAYILDKGKSLGMPDLGVIVTVAWSEGGYWYPCSVSLETSADKAVRDELGNSIEAELGIKPEELIWRMGDED